MIDMVRIKSAMLQRVFLNVDVSLPYLDSS